jgi:glycine cleavage system transcriptional repressor
MPEFAVTAIGRDRPGIVAAISEALLGLEGNIADSQMSILRGHFAVMLIVTVPDGVSSADLEERLGGARETLGLEAIAVNPVGDAGAGAARPFAVLTVYGADHPGIGHAVSSALAEMGVNITDLETRLSGTPETPLYVMMMEVALGDGKQDDVEARLRAVGRDAEVEVSLRPLHVEVL